MTEAGKQCEQMIMPLRHGFGIATSPHQCQRQAKVHRDGANYCTQHDPVRIAEKAAERRESWKRHCDALAGKEEQKP